MTPTPTMIAAPEELRALVEWEMFCDAAYFDMWCVRRVGDAAFGSGFHLPSMGEAQALLAALTRAESSLASPAGTEGWMPIETVYVVGGTVGEWSDRSEWTVGVWVSEADAKAFVEKISALGRVFEQIAQTRYDSDEAEAAVIEAEKACMELDSGWSSYCSDAPRYTVWPEKLILPAAPRGESE